jgi:uncharacterized membrane protein
LMGFIFAGFIGEWFGMQVESIAILRMLFFAAGLQVMFLYIVIFLMYFDLSKISFYVVALFFVLNLLFNLYFILNPIVILGTGYLFAIGITAAVGIFLLMHSVTDIEYKIFMRQEN